MSFESGDIIDGRYKILGILGEGGHGVVYRAEDQVMSASVAIKCLHADVAAQPGFKARMKREARAMGELSGTSAVQVRSFSEDTEAGMYIVMEFLQGKDLSVYLQEQEQQGRKLSIQKLLELLDPIVETLAAAHARQIIHRDLKPGNIFVLDSVARGPVRLLDFGLAKDLRADPLTQEGTIAGSPSYIAPEVWRGKPELLDHRIDIYSLGAVVYRMLTGKPPFAEPQMLDLLMAVTRGERPSLHALRPDLPRTIDAWAAKALAIAPTDRFQSVRALWNVFQMVVAAD